MTSTPRAPSCNGAVQDLQPSGTKPVTVYAVANRRELRRCFPKLSCNTWGTNRRLLELFSAVPLHPALKRAYDFREEAPAWHFSLVPVSNWSDVLARLAEEASGVTLETRFGISTDAARLLGWLQQLASPRLTSGWSPNVEEFNEREIGFKPVTRREDFAFYLRTLLDEINERTPFTVTSYSYAEYSSTKTRLKLASKPSDLDLVVRQLQWLGLQQGKLVAREAAANVITTFLAQVPASSSAAI